MIRTTNEQIQVITPLSLPMANWLAHILDDNSMVPRLESKSEAISCLEHLRRSLGRWLSENPVPLADPDLLHTYEDSKALDWILDELTRKVDEGGKIDVLLGKLRHYLRGVSSFALIIGTDSDPIGFPFYRRRQDDWRELMHRVPRANLDYFDPNECPSGVIVFHIESSPALRGPILIESVHPVIEIALRSATRWPGLLLWRNRHGWFFELDASRMGEDLDWIFSHLAVGGIIELVKERYDERRARRSLPLQLIHMSDLHLGWKAGRQRLARIISLVSSVAATLKQWPMVPVITGDLMETPTDDNLDLLRQFLEPLRMACATDSVIVLGNHDVRKGGILAQELGPASHLSNDRIRWFDKSRVGLVCFNSVRSGRLARGHIDDREFLDLGSALDASPARSREYALIALLHHHPLPVQRPDWYKPGIFERLFPAAQESAEELENASQFLAWLKTRRVPLVLHGHKHVPRISTHRGITVVGCGSTIGKIETKNPGETYISMNLVTVDVDARRVCCRLLAERLPGGGLNEEFRHEVVLSFTPPEPKDSL